MLTTFKHSKEWWPGRVEEILHQIISFAFFSFINNIKSTNYNYVLIFKLQSEKKTLTVKHHEAYLTRMNFPIMWWKKGMITFPVGGSVFSYNIFAASKSCVILQNYPNKILFSSSHPQRCTATCAYTVNMNHDAHSLVE